MKYKKLLVSGCSFTENPGNWASCLAAKYNLELINLAVPGAGNNHVVWSLISYIERHQIDPETTLVGVMWSHPARNDFVFEQNTEYRDQSIYTHKYDSANSLVMQRDLERRELPKLYTQLNFLNHFHLIEKAKTKVQARRNQSAVALKTWTLKTSLTAYLENKKFDFFQTGFLNYLNESALLKANTDWSFHKTFSYVSELDRIGLSSKLSNWLSLTDSEYLGEYAFFNNLLDDDKLHPSPAGYEQWTNEILIPKLKDLTILS
jgi:hypothetical protein